MATPASVKDLFEPLDKRLSLFESNRHGRDYSDPSIEWTMNIDYARIIYKIVNAVNDYKQEEVFNMALVYEERVKLALKNLKPVLIVYVRLAADYYEDTRVSEKNQKMMMERWQNELKTYVEQLQMIQRVTLKRIELAEGEKQLSDSGQNTMGPLVFQPNQINLPENFTVSQLNKLFEPQLSVNQVALFLYYLREHAVMPPYSDSAIGKLAESFFVRNQKNVTKGLTDIYTIMSNEMELSNLKKVLQKIIKEIDNDLKEAR